MAIKEIINYTEIQLHLQGKLANKHAPRAAFFTKREKILALLCLNKTHTLGLVKYIFFIVISAIITLLKYILSGFH